MFRQFVYGLYFGAAYFFLLFFGDLAMPGVLSGGAFGDIAIISLFAMMVLDLVFSLR